MIGSIWMVRWGNPYTNPPEGKARVLAERFYPAGHPNQRVCPDELMQMCLPGSGYTTVWQAVEKQVKRLPKDRLALVRQKRLRRRMEKKYPLLAEWMIEQELAKRPEFYAGVTDKHLEQARNAVEEQERQRLARLILEYEEGEAAR